MTDFQMSLIAAGGVFVVGVISYNKWQEYKARKSVERAFSNDHDDVLMRTDPVTGEPAADLPADLPAGRHEPVFDTDAAPAGAEALDGARLEPHAHAERQDAPLSASASSGAAPLSAAFAASADFVHASPAQAAPAVATPAAQQAENLVDPLIDCLIPINSEGPLRGDRILASLLKLRRVGNKPVHFVGLAVSGDWEPVVRGGVYTRLQAGLQLATRTTALNELEYSEMVTRLREVADEIGAEADVPDMIEVMSEARTLHRFVAGHDAQLGVNLVSKGAPWAITTLIGALESAGFGMRPDGRFAMTDSASNLAPNDPASTLFTLSTNVTLGADTTSRLTLLLDVPCVAPAKDGFGRMAACARDLVGRLDAVIVDDFDQPLSDAALDEIAGQVTEFYQEMEAADIPAGSTRALRLFS